MRGELVAEFFKFGAQFQVIVDFAVEDNAPFAGIFEDRLIAALQVDNLQSRRAAGKRFRGERALLIRPAVVQGSKRLLNPAVRRDSVFMREAGDAAQAVPLSKRPIPCLNGASGESGMNQKLR
jgi:hypothetical protein